MPGAVNITSGLREDAEVPPVKVTVAGVNDQDQEVGSLRLVSVNVIMEAVVPLVALALKPAIGRIAGVILK